ncbi:atlastin-2-like [Styela clava]
MPGVVEVQVNGEPTPAIDEEEIMPKGPYPVPIVVTTEKHNFTLDEEKLSSLLLQDSIKDLHVAVISVAGAFRKGKSFLLNFFLRYLQSNGDVEWMGQEDTELSGFSWRGGSERDTTGILMWSEVFTCTTPSGEKIAVILLDTQGAFDSQSTVKDCATVFALSTMTSSVQVYNISQNLQEDDLQHLHLFTEYGRLAMEEFSDKPFQSLQFLVRDWSYPYEFDYGLAGGEKVLEKRLETREELHDELQRVRSHIQSCFSGLSCFLMPHPGLKVATHPKFRGCLKDIDSDFKTNLKELVPLLLSPENLVVKEINGSKVTCKDLVEYFKAYVKIYQGEELPEPKTMLQATAEANNLAAVAQARDLYIGLMEKVCGGDMPYVNPELLDDRHNEIKQQAEEQFTNTRKMGGEEFSARYKINLIKDIDEAFDSYIKANDAKNIFHAGRTPATFFACALLCYIISALFGFVYIDSLAALFNLAFVSCLAGLLVWSYARFTGKHNEVAQTLDNIANAIWEGFMNHMYEAAVEKAQSQPAVQDFTRRLSTQVQSSLQNKPKTN